jgi:hypothetical protein
MTASGLSSVYREVTADRADEYAAKGHPRRQFFPHRIYHLPKCGPDGYKLAARLCGHDDPAAMWEMVLYADPATIADFPPDLFFDDDVVWHRQQFGRPGQVATANVVVDGTTVHSMGHLSDLVQRIGRRHEHKAKIGSRFRNWAHMLLNAVVAFAAERGAREVRTPAARLAMRQTDPAREVHPELFWRVYDRAVTTLVPARRDGEWWVVDVQAARERLVIPTRRVESRARRPAVCICHDVASVRGLKAVREIEVRLGVRATYFVPGSLMSQAKDVLGQERHCLAFRSFGDAAGGQLDRCRDVDNRLKGYRPPESRMTAELSDRNLLFHNFEWLAGSPASLGVARPELRAGVVRLPVPFTGHELRSFCLDGRRAADWLPGYPDFLERARGMGELKTLDEVAADVTLAAAA